MVWEASKHIWKTIFHFVCKSDLIDAHKCCLGNIQNLITDNKFPFFSVFPFRWTFECIKYLKKSKLKNIQLEIEFQDCTDGINYKIVHPESLLVSPLLHNLT